MIHIALAAGLFSFIASGARASRAQGTGRPKDPRKQCDPTNAQLRILVLSSAMAVMLLAACGRKDEERPSSPTATPTLSSPTNETEDPADIAQESPEIHSRMIALARESEYRKAQEIRDRQELVIPRVPGWTPEFTGRRIKISLVPERTSIRQNDAFRYRLEVRNVGNQPIRFLDLFGSVIKSPRALGMDGFSFFITSPSGDEEKALRRLAIDAKASVSEIRFPGPSSASDREASFVAMERRSKAAGSLSLTLQPGETLVSRSDRPNGRFVELATRYRFEAAGTYKIRVEFDPGRHATPSEDHILALVRLGRTRREAVEELLNDMASPPRTTSNETRIEILP